MELADRMKEYEKEFTKISISEELPVLVRLDGKTFSTFTKGLKKPFDERLSQIMIDVTNFLVEKTGANLGYTQSDEITLLFMNQGENSQIYLGGRVQKTSSILASMATAKFNDELRMKISEKSGILAFFDARVWNVPTVEEAFNVFLWRHQDAIKNSISMAAYANFPHKKLDNKNSSEKIDMLNSIGISWGDYPEFFKSGTFSKKENYFVKVPDELKKYKSNEGKEFFVRSKVVNFNMESLRFVENRELFLGVKKEREECVKKMSI